MKRESEVLNGIIVHYVSSSARNICIYSRVQTHFDGRC